jgi:colanic acid/amylovoran biosynthesis glycosyltransferase
MKTVAHYKRTAYLAKTETWIYSQIINVRLFKPVFYSPGLVNARSFPLDRVRNVNLTVNPAPGNLIKAVNDYYRPVALRMAILWDRPAVVHAHYGPSGYEFLPFKQLFRIPMVTTFYGFDVNMLPTSEPVWKERYQSLFKEGNMFLTEGSFMKQCLVRLGCDEKKVVVQHLGVDLGNIKFIPRRLGRGEVLKILISGSFREKKGIPYAIEAIGLYIKKNPLNKVLITVIGDAKNHGREISEKNAILETVERFKLQTIVKFLGYQSHQVFIDELYRNHIFLSPSVVAVDGDTEGGAPVSIIEASASGMPILSTTHCDIPEVVIDGVSGCLVPERNSTALAEKLDFLVQNSEKWEEMGACGRKHIEKNYDVRHQGVLLEEIYQHLIAGQC